MVDIQGNVIAIKCNDTRRLRDLCALAPRASKSHNLFILQHSPVYILFIKRFERLLVEMQ